MDQSEAGPDWQVTGHLSDINSFRGLDQLRNCPSLGLQPVNKFNRSLYQLFGRQNGNIVFMHKLQSTAMLTPQTQRIYTNENKSFPLNQKQRCMVEEGGRKENTNSWNSTCQSTVLYLQPPPQLHHSSHANHHGYQGRKNIIATFPLLLTPFLTRK